ncbi:TPA: hypothetical protein DCZ39_02610 [Patescibacteria group bacterium]|nr:hypothetical protein [Candidatus Gracilibacteria bacterium]
MSKISIVALNHASSINHLLHASIISCFCAALGNFDFTISNNDTHVDHIFSCESNHELYKNFICSNSEPHANTSIVFIFGYICLRLIISS